MEIEYNGRLVDSDNFRVVLHHKDGIMRVAEGWVNYQNLLKTGEWFEKRPIVSRETQPPKRRRKKAVNDANGS
jgi:hypothetical protein